ncbi:MAG TPA: hypothetical protein VF494_07805 [Candidatus Limnocylindrales bacterium]
MIDPASPGALGELPAPGTSGLPPGEPDLVPGSGPVSGGGAPGRPGFAHASEAEMSRILDFYGVAWRYEPTTFPILWNLDGDVVESFSPDFYLPEFDLYLEMTTLKQSLVRKKNRKLRRLRELYPDIRIKLFYARDFRAMMLKYGRLGLAESLSGASGQLGGTPAIDDEPRSIEPAPRSITALATTPPARRRTMRRTDRSEATRGADAAVAKGEGERA